MSMTKNETIEYMTKAPYTYLQVFQRPGEASNLQVRDVGKWQRNPRTHLLEHTRPISMSSMRLHW